MPCYITPLNLNWCIRTLVCTKKCKNIRIRLQTEKMKFNELNQQFYR